MKPKPCPFCGNEAKPINNDWRLPHQKWCYLQDSVNIIEYNWESWNNFTKLLEEREVENNKLFLLHISPYSYFESIECQQDSIIKQEKVVDELNKNIDDYIKRRVKDNEQEC